MTAPEQLLTCAECGALKPADAFHRESSRPTGRNRRCKECRNARNRALVARDPARRAETMQRWQRRNPERYAAAKRAHALRRYGLTLAEYDRLLATQDGLCAVCRLPESPGWELAVDHDHASGLVRGLLCRRCNVGLGLLRDDPAVVEAAARYLRAATPTRVGPLVDSAPAAATDATPSTTNAAP